MHYFKATSISGQRVECGGSGIGTGIGAHAWKNGPEGLIWLDPGEGCAGYLLLWTYYYSPESAYGMKLSLMKLSQEQKSRQYLKTA